MELNNTSIKYTSITAVIMLCIGIEGFSQYNISGHILSTSKQPVQYVEVILENADSISIQNTFTDSAGYFFLTTQEKKFNVVARKFGTVLFANWYTDVSQNIDLGNVQVNDSKLLKNVIIASRKKTIERKLDRLIFNVENSINASSTDAFEVLKVTPGVKVQNEKIKMVGKSKLTVMVDGKIIQLSDEELSSFLKSIPSDDIKSIEVITTPPSQYDALGNSGIINILLKKARKNSWSALAGTSYLKRTYGDVTTNAGFNYNKNKIRLSLSGLFRKGVKYGKQDDYANFPDENWHTNQPYKNTYKRFNGSLSLDYNISKKQTIGLQFLSNAGRIVATDQPYSDVTNDSNVTTKYLQSYGEGYYSPTIYALNLHDEYKFDSSDKKLLINLDYFTFNNTDDKKYNGKYDIYNPNVSQFYTGKNINAQQVKNISGKVDFELPLKWIALNFGTKYSLSTSNNSISFYNSGFTDTLVTTIDLNSNKFVYDENVFALYISGAKKINEKNEIQIGCRMEHTTSNALNKSTNLDRDYKYTKFYPTFFWNKTISDSKTMSLSYSRRVDRPTFFDLNPNVYYINPYQSIEGNAFLQPAFIDNVEFIYTYKKIENKLFYSNERNLYAQVPDANPSTFVINYTNKNYITAHRIGLSESFLYEKYSWWTNSITLDIGYVYLLSNLTSTKSSQQGFNARITTNNDFSLNKRKTLLANLNFWYSFPEVDGIYYLNNKSNLSLSIQKFFFDKKLRLLFRTNDLLAKELDNQTTKVNGVFQRGIYYDDVRSFQFSLVYKFGNKNIKKTEKETGNTDEKNRTGN